LKNKKTTLEEIKKILPKLKEMHERKEEFRKIHENSKNATDGMLALQEWEGKSKNIFRVC
jgi:transposase